MDDFVSKLTKVHERLNILWPKGRESSCCTNDGVHYILPNSQRPVSSSQVESRLLFNLVIVSNAKRVFEIGTGFGYSSFWLAAALNKLHGKRGWLGSLDNFSEGDLGRGSLTFAKENSKFLGLDDITHFFVGESPQMISDSVSVGGPLDLAFIDGNHHGEGPCLDYQGLKPHLAEESLLVWHDVQSKYGVAKGLSAAIQDGWFPVVFPTSCRICVSYRTLTGFDYAQKAYEAASDLCMLKETRP